MCQINGHLHLSFLNICRFDFSKLLSPADIIFKIKLAKQLAELLSSRWMGSTTGKLKAFLKAGRKNAHRFVESDGLIIHAEP
jgi:hypothetical protein